MAKTYAIDVELPDGDSNARLGDDAIRLLAKAVAELMGVNHYIGTPVNNAYVEDDAGKHSVIHFRESQGSNPVLGSNDKGIFFIKQDGSSNDELFFIDAAGNLIQVSVGGKINGAALSNLQTYAGGGLTDDDTKIPTAKAIKQYVEANAPTGFCGYLTSSEGGTSYADRALTVLWNSALYNGGTKRITIPKDGQYGIIIGVDGTTYYGTTLGIRVYKNGTTEVVKGEYTNSSFTTGGIPYHGHADNKIIVNLDEGDYLTLQTKAGGSSQALGGSDTFISLYRIGAQV